MSLGKAQVFGAFALGLLLMAYSAEAFRLCSSASKTFHGPCKSHMLCATVCHHEHFTGGHCSRKKLADEVDGGELVVDDGDDLGGGDDDDVAWWRKKKQPKCICVRKCSKPTPPGGDPAVPPPGDDPTPPGREPPTPPGDDPTPPGGEPPQPPSGDEPPAGRKMISRHKREERIPLFPPGDDEGKIPLPPPGYDEPATSGGKDPDAITTAQLIDADGL